MKKETLSIDEVLKAATQKEEVQSIKTASKKAGRKPLDPDDRADQRVVLYFSRNQLREIKKAAKRFDKNLGTFIKDTFYEVFQENQPGEIDKFIESLNEEEIGKLLKTYLSQRK